MVSVAAVVRVMVPTRGDGGIFDHFGVSSRLTVQTSQPDRNQQSAIGRQGAKETAVDLAMSRSCLDLTGRRSAGDFVLAKILELQRKF